MNTGERLAVVERRQDDSDERHARTEKRDDEQDVKIQRLESHWSRLGGSWVAITIAAAALVAIAGIAAHFLPGQAPPTSAPVHYPSLDVDKHGIEPWPVTR